MKEQKQRSSSAKSLVKVPSQGVFGGGDYTMSAFLVQGEDLTDKYGQQSKKRYPETFADLTQLFLQWWQETTVVS